MVVWLLGDLCNIIGALLAALQSTVIILALYVSDKPCLSLIDSINFHLQYTVCDMILLFQIYYYRHTHPVRVVEGPPKILVNNANGEETPLLTRKDKVSRRPSIYGETLKYLLALVFVMATGVIAWIISDSGASDLDPQKPKDVIEWKSQVIGWTSAFLYRKIYRTP